MQYFCENTQHFGWGTSCRLRDPDGNIMHMDVLAARIAAGFVLPKEGEPYTMPDTMTDEEKGPAEEPDEDPGQTDPADPMPTASGPVSER